MGRYASHLGGPPELQETIEGYFSFTELPTCGVYRLLQLAFEGRGDYTWGFRIYRTTYQDGSDKKFAKAMEVLNEWIRDECFSYDCDNRHGGDVVNPPLDPKANEQLWLRLRNETVEDRELLEDATPDKILKLSQDWVHLDQQATTKDNPRYRFFLVIDEEVINQLLNLPKNPMLQTFQEVFSIKVYDARYNSPPQFSGGESDSDDEEVYNEYEDPDEAMYGYEGWFWISASKLMYLWFCDYQSDEELVTIDDSWDGIKRFIHTETAIGALPLAETIRKSLAE